MKFNKLNEGGVVCDDGISFQIKHIEYIMFSISIHYRSEDQFRYFGVNLKFGN